MSHRAHPAAIGRPIDRPGHVRLNSVNASMRRRREEKPGVCGDEGEVGRILVNEFPPGHVFFTGRTGLFGTVLSEMAGGPLS